MGYRSQVRLITTKKGFEELKSFNDKYLQDHKGINGFEEYNLMDELTLKEEDNHSVYFGWDWVKWYEGSYKSVDAIMNGLNHLRDKDMSFRFSRLGEDYDDYEEQYHDSEKEEEQGLEFPYVIRDFDDSEMIDNLQKNVVVDKELET